MFNFGSNVKENWAHTFHKIVLFIPELKGRQTSSISLFQFEQGEKSFTQVIQQRIKYEPK